MIKEEKVETYIQRIYCDDCDEELESTGVVFLTYPEQVEYQCPKCKKRTTYLGYYPKTIYKNLKEEEKKDE